MKTDKIVKLSAEKSKERKKEVIAAINKMASRGEKISFYSVQNTTGASKSYLYGNEEIRTLIESLRGAEVKHRTTKGNRVIIEAQRKKIKDLEKTIEKLQADNSDSYKLKYEKLLQENALLKQQIKNSTYSYS